MNYREFGDKRRDTIVFLHGGGLSWWNYRQEAEMLGSSFHIIIPILDGHAGSDRGFTSIEDNAREILDFINRELKGSVFMLCGLSLGAQILLEMLAVNGSVCRFAIVESAAVIPSVFTNALMGPAIGSSYPLIRKEWFSRLQFRQLHMKDELYDDYYRDTCLIGKKDMTAFLKANTSYSLKSTLKDCRADVRVYYGDKETRTIRRSAEKIKSVLPESTVCALKDMHHGGLSLNRPEELVKIIMEIYRADE